MNFFEQQRQAKNYSLILLAAFVAAVAALSMATAVLIQMGLNPRPGLELSSPLLWKIAGSIFTGLVLVSFVRRMTLPSIGRLAELMGGEQVSYDSKDEKLRRLSNVVEEMAIASGVPVPMVFVLKDNPGINAFAAGEDPNNSVIAVTEGALENLSRDELQAVIGHEFSHILNGDMRLNLSLASMIFSLVMFSNLGRSMLGRPTRHRYRRRNQSDAKVGILGLGIFVFGLVGVVLAKMIQSLISQQREFLADAASAQFTRNPRALARVLAKIDSHFGSKITAFNHMEYSHLFFSSPQTLGFIDRFFQTHPPIETRIARLLKLSSKQVGPMMAELLSESSVQLIENVEANRRTLVKKHLDSDAPESAAIVAALARPQLESQASLLPDSLRTQLSNKDFLEKSVLGLMQPAALTDQVELVHFLKADGSQARQLLLYLHRELMKLSREQKISLLNKALELAKQDGLISPKELSVLILLANALLDSTKKAGFQELQQAAADAFSFYVSIDSKGQFVGEETFAQRTAIAAGSLGIDPRLFRRVSIELSVGALGTLRRASPSYKNRLLNLLIAQNPHKELLESIALLLGTHLQSDILTHHPN